MSYFIQRIKLAELCREVVDLVPMSMYDISTVDYQQVVALDQRFDGFRNDEQSIQQSEQVVARYPQVRMQRQLLSMLAKTKRCKLHQPFLIRGSVNMRYSYSRTISQKSARALLEERRGVISSHPHDRYKLGGHTSYYVFMATIVLVMDLFFNKKSSSDNSNSDNTENGDDETRVTKAEVMEACRSLYQDQSAPGLGTTYLASLMDVPRKYKVKLRPPATERIKSNTRIEPNTTTNAPYQTPNLLAQQPSYAVASSTQRVTQVPSIPVPPTPSLQRPVTTSTNNSTKTGNVNTESSSSISLNPKSHFNKLPCSNNRTAGSTVPTETEGYLANFDDIWNGYVDLGPNLAMSYWDSMFSDLGPGMG